MVFVILKCVIFKGSIVDPYSGDLNSCTKVPCQVEREKYAMFEVVFDPNGKLLPAVNYFIKIKFLDSPTPINLLKFEAFWIFDGTYKLIVH